MCTFYRGTIESILTSCITVWYGACNASCRKSLQRIVRAAEKIVGVSLPSLQDIYSTRLTRKALSISGDPTHPTHSFFSLLPSGRRLRSLQARTNRLKDSFIHQAVRKLNSLPSLPPPPLLHHAPLNSDPCSCTTPFIFCTVWLFHWFALYLPCALCHFIYLLLLLLLLLLFFLHVLICNSCICVCMGVCVYICIYIYIYIHNFIFGILNWYT